MKYLHSFSILLTAESHKILMLVAEFNCFLSIGYLRNTFDVQLCTAHNLISNIVYMVLDHKSIIFLVEP